MKTNEKIFQEIRETGVITESNIRLLKNRSNREGKNLFDYSLLEQINGGNGIPVTEEQGLKGLAWLFKFMKRGIYGNREIEIIKNASCNDFLFVGFYDSGSFYRNYLPTYKLNGMQYVPMAEPYIIG